jgi:hypothetical protein
VFRPEEVLAEAMARDALTEISTRGNAARPND